MNLTDLINVAAEASHDAWVAAQRDRGVTTRPDPVTGREQLVRYQDAPPETQQLARESAQPVVQAILTKVTESRAQHHGGPGDVRYELLLDRCVDRLVDTTEGRGQPTPGLRARVQLVLETAAFRYPDPPLDGDIRTTGALAQPLDAAAVARALNTAGVAVARIDVGDMGEWRTVWAIGRPQHITRTEETTA